MTIQKASDIHKTYRDDLYVVSGYGTMGRLYDLTIHDLENLGIEALNKARGVITGIDVEEGE